VVIRKGGSFVINVIRYQKAWIILPLLNNDT